MQVAAPCEHDVLQEAQAEGKYFCTKDRAHALQKKRKRGQDPWTKGREKAFLLPSAQGYNLSRFLRSKPKGTTMKKCHAAHRF